MSITLTREVRFALHSDPAPTSRASNGFAGNPPLAGFAPFVALSVSIAAPIDPETGMIVNIKLIDSLVRDTAVDLLRAFAHAPAASRELHTASAALAVFDRLDTHLAARQESVDAIRLALSPYLSLAVYRQEKPMVRLSQRSEFSAAHRLHAEALSDAENAEIFGRCNNPNGHGHNYELEVTVVGPGDSATGQVMPVAQLQQIVNQHVIEVFDHKHLNVDCADFRNLIPTVENIAQVIHRRIKPHIPGPARLAAVRLWETPKTMAEVSE